MPPPSTRIPARSPSRLHINRSPSARALSTKSPSTRPMIQKSPSARVLMQKSPSARVIIQKSPSALRIGLSRTPRAPSLNSQSTSTDILDIARQTNPEMTGDITRAAMDDFRQLFDMFDKDGNGEIDSTEFGEIVRMLGDERPSNDELTDMIRLACEIDPQDPTPTSLTFAQFMRFFAMYKQDWPTDVSDTDIFNVLDEDCGGTISPKELWKVLNRFGMRVTEDEANAMADFATPLPGPNEIGSADMTEVAVRVRRLRERHRALSVASSYEDD